MMNDMTRRSSSREFHSSGIVFLFERRERVTTLDQRGTKRGSSPDRKIAAPVTSQRNSYFSALIARPSSATLESDNKKKTLLDIRTK